MKDNKKICTKCGKKKLLSEFQKDKQKKDGLRSFCKKCSSKQSGKYYENNKDIINLNKKIMRKKFPWKYTLKAIKQRCNNSNTSYYKDYGGRGIECRITEDELEKLWYRDKGCDMDRPSIDREDNNGHYEYGNCRYIEKSKNTAERNIRVSSKPVFQFDLNDNFIIEYKSQTEAELETGINSRRISEVVLGKRKSAGGFIWRYQND